MLELLLILLFVLLIINYALGKREILSPAFLFTLGFLVSVAWAYAFRDKWGLNLKIETFWVILGGVGLFSIVAAIVSIFFMKRTLIEGLECDNRYEISVSRTGGIIIIGIMLVTIVYTVFEVQKIAPSGSIMGSIYAYRMQTTNITTDNASSLVLPKLLALLRNFTDAAGYFFAYILANELFKRKRVNVVALVITFLSLINGMLLGSRTGAFMLLLSFMIFLYIMYRASSNWKKHLSLKMLGMIALLFIIIIFTFQSFAGLLGREVGSFSKANYLAIYFGAEIKNLDTFIQAGQFPIHPHGTFGAQTFLEFNRTFGKFFGSNATVILDLPFQNINGLSLGNVYTTFYAFLYDFGYRGVVLLVILMSFVSQFVYEKVRHFTRQGDISIYTLIYSRIAVCLILSFFSDKFYEGIFAITFIKTVAWWVVLRWIFVRNRVGILK